MYLISYRISLHSGPILSITYHLIIPVLGQMTACLYPTKSYLVSTSSVSRTLVWSYYLIV
jgi:hypothetical protein